MANVLKMAIDGNHDDTGTETGEGDVDDKGGDLQT